MNDEVEGCVFQTAFEAFGQRRPYSESNYYIVWVLLGSVWSRMVSECSGHDGEEDDVHGRQSTLAGGEMAEDGVESFGSHCRIFCEPGKQM